jgi:hypothetical protein
MTSPARRPSPLPPAGTYSSAVAGVRSREDLDTHADSVALSAFQTSTTRGIALHVNDRITYNATLQLAGMEAAIEVTADTGLIQTTPAVQTLMGPTQVQELPLNNRNFVQLATLVPGVSSSLGDEVGIGLTSSVSVSMAGGRRNAVNWFVDGASNVDVGSNITLLSTPTLDSIEEFKIITSSYAAECSARWRHRQHRDQGGSNTFRASAYEFYRNDSLNANSFFRKQSSDPRSPLARRSSTTTTCLHPRRPDPKDKLSCSSRRSGVTSHARPPPRRRPRSTPPGSTTPRTRTTSRPPCATRTRSVCSRRGPRPTPAPTSTATSGRTTRTPGSRSPASTGTSTRAGG